MRLNASARAAVGLAAGLLFLVGCGGGAVKTTSGLTPGQEQTSRYRAMENFEKSQAAKSQPAR